MSSAWLVVGLGNPGPQYVDTRHNIGALCVEDFAREHGASLGRHKRALAQVAEFKVGIPGSMHQVIAAVPLSYMNESGGPVKALMSFYNVSPENLIVVHDELDIDFGQIRVKCGGGDGGHNGLKSIRKALGTGDYFRVRLGIGRPPGQQDPAGFVLQRFSGTQRAELGEFLDRGCAALTMLLDDGLEAAQNRYNGR